MWQDVRQLPAEVAGPADSVHQATLERAFGRIFAVVALAIVLYFWVSAAAMRGQRPGSLAANLLLSGLLVGQAVRAYRRPPSQQDLDLLAASTVVLVLASRILATPGSPFLEQAAYVMVVPAAAAWATWSRRFAVPGPPLLMIMGTGAWCPAGAGAGGGWGVGGGGGRGGGPGGGGGRPPRPWPRRPPPGCQGRWRLRTLP